MSLEYPDILEKIIVFSRVVDLYVLMRTSKTIRDIVGQSDVWKYVPGDTLSDLPKYINVEEIFKLFVSIRLSKKSFAVRQYYGNWYYLYTMKRWFTNSGQNTWSLYSLLQLSPLGEMNDIEKMSKICGFISAPHETKEYHDWSLLMPELSEKLTASVPFAHPERDKILQLIYVSTSSFDYGEHSAMITITNTKIKQGPKHSKFYWYPIERRHGGIIFPEHFYYRFIFTYFANRDDQCLYSKNNGPKITMYSHEFLDKISKISWKLEVKYETLLEIIRIVLGKTIRKCERKVNLFMKYPNSYNEDPDSDE